MANKAHDHLHRLIRSMTKAEKRYFKVHSGRHLSDGERRYHRLFDAIAAAEEYDEATIIQRFSQEAFTHRFAITKRRLYETVLASLEAFHAEASVDARLGRMLHEVRILHDRSLYPEAAKVLQSFTRLARTHDRQPMLLAALEWEQRLAERDGYAHVLPEDLERMHNDRSSLDAEVRELNDLWELKSRIFLLLYRKGQARDKDAVDQLQGLLADPLLQDDRPLGSVRARYLRDHIRSAASFALNDLERCLRHLQANRALMEQEHDRFSAEPQTVLSVLGNLAFVCTALGRFDEAREHLDAFRSSPARWSMPENEDLDIKLFNTSYSLELGMHLRTGDVDQALELVPAIERGLERYGDRIGPLRRAGFLYQLAYAHFMAGRMDAALRWTNRLLDGLRADDASDLATTGRMLYLALLIETGKLDLLPYALRNTERFLQNRARMYAFEPHFLELVRLLGRSTDSDQRQAALNRFLEQMTALLQNPLERTVLDQFDAWAWAGGKVGGKPMAELVRQRMADMTRAA